MTITSAFDMLHRQSVDRWDRLTPNAVRRLFDEAENQRLPLLDLAIWLDTQPLPALIREQLPTILDEYEVPTPVATCGLCGEVVSVDDRRDHLMDHNPNASHFTGREVAEFFTPTRKGRSDNG